MVVLIEFGSRFWYFLFIGGKEDRKFGIGEVFVVVCVF